MPNINKNQCESSQEFIEKDSTSLPEIPDADADSQNGNTAKAQKLWRETKPAAETPVETYLKGRGITGEISAALRYHPEVYNSETKALMPCMVAAVSVLNGQEIIAIHRTYLKENKDGGVTKADVRTPKMLLGSLSGGSVGLSKLAANQPLIIAEGIETALSVLQAYPEACVWSILSASNFHNLTLPPKEDFSEIIIAADHDKAGINAAEKAANKWMGEGYTVKISLPDGEGEDFNHVLMRDRDGEKKIKQIIGNATVFEAAETLDQLNRDCGIDTKFVLRKTGVFCKKEDGEMQISPYIAPRYVVGNSERNEQCLHLEFYDETDGALKTYDLPKRLLAATQGFPYLPELKSRGFSVLPEHYKLFDRFLLTARPKQTLTTVNKQGWHGEYFVLPHKVFRRPDAQEPHLRLQQNRELFSTQGTLQEWQERIGKLCMGNDILILSVAAALVGPLLHMAGEENFGVHICGGSSTGKTTALHVAASVWGCSVKSWRTTDNAAESMAKQANDTILILDEISQVSGSAADAMSYMLGNGVTKGRARRDGTAQPIETFRNVFLSSGETGLNAKLQETGKSMKAGQAVRLIELSADAGAGLGVFQCLHGRNDGAALSNELKDQSRDCYGVVADAFLEGIVSMKQSELKTLLRTYSDAWSLKSLPPKATGQAQRVSQHLALLASAGELAIQLGVLNWPEGTVDESIARLLNTWVQARGGTHPHEFQEAERRIVTVIESRQYSCFQSIGDHAQRINDCIGYKNNQSQDGWTYGFTAGGFSKEVIGSLPRKSTIKHLVDFGFLLPDAAGKSSRVVKLDGKNMRLYCISDLKLTRFRDEEPTC